MTASARHGCRALALTLCALGLGLPWPGCGRSPESAATPASPTPAAAAADEPLEPAPEATPFPPGVARLFEPFKGDLDGMIERRVVRVLTVQSPIIYFVDRGREVGTAYESMKAFEKQLNRELGNEVVRVYAIAIPVARDELIPRLLAGQGDLALAQLTVTPERKRQVDFSEPVMTGIREVLVSGPDGPPVARLEELSGREVYVRSSSSYAEHLAALNRRFAAEGRPPVKITPAPEVLEDGDILEMVSAGLAPATVVDDVTADLYTQVFPNLRKHSAIASPPDDVAWAFRKGSPRLAAAVNGFVRKHKQGTLAGNIVINRYLKSTRWVKNARSHEDRKRFLSMIDTFRKYADMYGLDPLLMAAQGYQESGLDQSKRSRVGAIGVMQVMPATARDEAIGIPDIENLESNIHAGIKYNRWMMDNFYNEPGITPLNKGMFSLASYNAGPSRVASLRREARAQGLDPNRWFNHVELVAAKRIGRETVTYVSNIYKYYLAYRMMLDGEKARREAMEAAGKR